MSNLTLNELRFKRNIGSCKSMSKNQLINVLIKPVETFKANYRKKG